MLKLSDEQQAVVYSGYTANDKWQEIIRPVGPQTVPAWCKGAHVSWMDDYGNAPDFKLKTVGEIFGWENQRWRKEGSRYIAEHPDGRLKMYGHGGLIGMHKIQMFRGEDGVCRMHRRYGPQWPNGQFVTTSVDGTKSGYEPGEFVEVEHLATTQQGGFAGRHYMITLEDGRDLLLRGPWHLGSPKGYQGITTVDCTKRDPWSERRGNPWHKRGGCFGLYLRQDVLVNILSRYLPHLRLALVTTSYSSLIEPMKPEWSAPKRWEPSRRAA